MRQLLRVAQKFITAGDGTLKLFEVPANTRFTLREIDADSNGYAGAKLTVQGGGGALSDHILIDGFVLTANVLQQWRFNLPFYAGEVLNFFIESGPNGGQAYVWVAGIAVSPTTETAPDWSA